MTKTKWILVLLAAMDMLLIAKRLNPIKKETLILRLLE